MEEHVKVAMEKDSEEDAGLYSGVSTREWRQTDLHSWLIDKTVRAVSKSYRSPT